MTKWIFKIGSGLPKVWKIIYYVVLAITLIALLLTAVEYTLRTIQRVGAFIFAKQNYWAIVTAAFILSVGGLLLAQFVFELDPFGKFIDWVVGLIQH